MTAEAHRRKMEGEAERVVKAVTNSPIAYGGFVDWFEVLGFSPAEGMELAQDNDRARAGEQCKRRYREQVILLHPDRNKEAQAANAFDWTTKAFNALKEPAGFTTFCVEWEFRMQEGKEERERREKAAKCEAPGPAAESKALLGYGKCAVCYGAVKEANDATDFMRCMCKGPTAWICGCGEKQAKDANACSRCGTKKGQQVKDESRKLGTSTDDAVGPVKKVFARPKKRKFRPPPTTTN